MERNAPSHNQEQDGFISDLDPDLDADPQGEYTFTLEVDAHADGLQHFLLANRRQNINTLIRRVGRLARPPIDEVVSTTVVFKIDKTGQYTPLDVFINGSPINEIVAQSGFWRIDARLVSLIGAGRITHRDIPFSEQKPNTDTTTYTR